jgi:type III secretion system YscQ/HrcQ family protein
MRLKEERRAAEAVPADYSAEANRSSFDPFASDIFLTAAAPKRSGEDHRSSLDDRAIATPWNRLLPRITKKQAYLSTIAPSLPDVLSLDSIERTLALVTRVPADQVSIAILDLREYSADSPHCRARKGVGVGAWLSAGPNDGSVLVETAAEFASGIIDVLLGGSGDPNRGLEALSRIELAVIEFLCLGLCREINEQLGISVFRLEQIVSTTPDWSIWDGAEAQENQDNPKGYLVAAFSVAIGRCAGILRVYFNPSAVTDLNSAINLTALTLADRPTRSRKRIARYCELSPDLRASLCIGRAEVTAGELAGLECGDVLVLDETSIQLREGRVSGHLSLRIGDAETPAIRGRALESSSGPLKEQSDAGANEVRVLVESVSTEPAATLAERFDMENNMDTGEPEAQGAAMLDGLLLTVHVELASRRIRMDELARLRVGQIIELGCLPTDPVDLLVDGRSIARGELVDIEGRLGVRITQVPA